MPESRTARPAPFAPGAWRSDKDIDADAPHETLPAWTPFEPIQSSGGAEQFYVENSRYVVGVTRLRLRLFGDRPQAVYRLGIQNFDQSARHDWRDFQRIKNELIGPEAEGFELYPAESRLVDPSNYFILWVLPKGDRIPVGVREARFVLTSDQAIAPQRATAVASADDAAKRRRKP